MPVGNVPGVGYATKRVRYADHAFFDEAAAFIERNRERPFFLEVSLTIPHANNQRAQALGDGMEVPGYGAYADRDWPDNEKGHAAMNELMDRRIGELLDQLKKLGLDDRTLVLFTSDNGPHREGGRNYDPEFFDSNGPLRGIKRDPTDGGVRVPLIARWPGQIQAGVVSDHVSYFGDVMATLAELARVAPPSGLDSISFAPTLLGKGEQALHPFLYWEFHTRGTWQAVLLDNRWKAIRQPAVTGPMRLYDVQADLGEATDVAAQHPDIVARVNEIMRTASVPNDYWDITRSAAAAKAKNKEEVEP
ncbi:MAG: sulfatase-like hydrolase/transferase [Opitutae bacterium]|nr:sulfatase-like hydrolase/transferase [Opitutae bacterium]